MEIRIGQGPLGPIGHGGDGGFGFGGGHSGDAPSPFDALPGGALAGLEGSHPLHRVDATMLLRPVGGDAVSGVIELESPYAYVGGIVRGRIRLVANRELEARAAHLRLVGLKLVEERQSREIRDSQGRVVRREEWVEAHGELFVRDPFGEPAIPTRLARGQAFEAAFAIPAPRLGPPSAHLGEAIVAWAIEVRWDVAMAGDPHLAVLLPVAQHPDLLRAGVGDQGGVSLMEEVGVDGATIRVAGLPARGGAPLEVGVRWPDAPAGRGARIELHRRSNAPNAAEAIIASVPVGLDELRAGAARASLDLPPGISPSFDGAGLVNSYVVRVIVDISFRPDVARERVVGIA